MDGWKTVKVEVTIDDLESLIMATLIVFEETKKQLANPSDNRFLTEYREAELAKWARINKSLREQKAHITRPKKKKGE